MKRLIFIVAFILSFCFSVFGQNAKAEIDSLESDPLMYFDGTTMSRAWSAMADSGVAIVKENEISAKDLAGMSVRGDSIVTIYCLIASKKDTVFADSFYCELSELGQSKSLEYYQKFWQFDIDLATKGDSLLMEMVFKNKKDIVLLRESEIDRKKRSQK